jgi:hypothetical protein
MSAAEPMLGSLARRLGDAGVPQVVLRADGPPDRSYWCAGGELEVLIPRRRRAAALRVLEDMDWTYQLGNSGAWRVLPMTNYWWPQNNVWVYWALPAAPFPARTLRLLQRELWASARPTPDGFLEPDPAVLLVHLAVQVARPNPRYHAADWKHFAACVDQVTDWDKLWRVAGTVGVKRAVERALTAAEDGAASLPSGSPFDGRRQTPWHFATQVQSRARPVWLRALLAGTPRLGDTPVRCRMASLEVRAGPGVFVPTPDAELLVKLALKRIDTAERVTAVEVGTGCGLIALAIADAIPRAEVHAVDTSRDAIRWARRNRRKLGLDHVRFYRGAGAEPLPNEIRGKVSVMLANLPFYPSKRFAPIAGVPRATIQGTGEDGLDLVRMLARDALAYLKPSGTLLLQMFAWQWDTLSPELVAMGYRPQPPARTGRFAIGLAQAPAMTLPIRPT